ncbi:class I tRNA ligase family protein [Melghirimyces algeriensis]|uniref:class I tRNA ligase family protein n=1 Tax=Melghirimyces algeriensis TaxID=910412 RepID=UPI00163DD8E1|nr:class I tRNA ligase family protein [Melghirimyces algeriensis]
MKTYLVTATPPTTNGDLHVGHLSGPYLAADVFSRYQKMQQNHVVYLSGGDDHQSYVVTTSKRLGTSPERLIKKQTENILSTFQAANIELDGFINSLGNREYIQFVQNFFLEMYEKGLLKEKTEPIHYCNQCQTYLFESHIKGKCPYCYEVAAGNLCEACGRVNRPVELIDSYCSSCESPPQITQYRGLFLPIDQYRTALQSFYNSRKSWRPHLKALCQWITDQPIPDYPVTYPADWGIRVPVQGFEDQVINVWFEMYPGHIYSALQWAQLYDHPHLNPTNKDTTFVQFLGYDNSFFNAVLHVTASLALDGKYIYPDHVITNEFYLLENEKFSTSRGHAIWGREIFEEVPSDALRYYLCRTNPEFMQTNFSKRAFERMMQNELKPLVETLERFGDLLDSDFPHGLLLEPQKLDLQTKGCLEWVKKGMETYLDIHSFSLYQSSAVLRDYSQAIQSYFNRYVLPMRSTNVTAYRDRLISTGFMFYGLVYFAYPIMPEFSTQLCKSLGMPSQPLKWSHVESLEPIPLSFHKECIPFGGFK